MCKHIKSAIEEVLYNILCFEDDCDLLHYEIYVLHDDRRLIEYELAVREIDRACYELQGWKRGKVEL